MLLCGLAAACDRAEAPPRPSQATAAPTAASAHAPEADPQRLVGRWIRSDADYAIAITSVSPDGKIEAAYLNPRPVHVSKAEARREDGALHVRLELQDKNYPGSYYTLTYDPGTDTLTGVYHHLGLNQEFDVAFSRLAAP
jgi:hypothetical protein